MDWNAGCQTAMSAKHEKLARIGATLMQAGSLRSIREKV